MARGDHIRVCAAASSIDRGRPSSVEQICATASKRFAARGQTRLHGLRSSDEELHGLAVAHTGIGGPGVLGQSQRRYAELLLPVEVERDAARDQNVQIWCCSQQPTQGAMVERASARRRPGVRRQVRQGSRLGRPRVRQLDVPGLTRHESGRHVHCRCNNSPISRAHGRGQRDGHQQRRGDAH